MSAQSERRHMNGRGPTLLAGKILEQNAWLTSPATSAEPSTSRRPRSSASSAKEKLLGKPKRNSKKSHQPRIQSSGPSTSQQHLSSPSVPMEEFENPFSLTPPNNEDSMLLDIHENACDPQIPAPSPPFESSPAESAPVDSAPFPDLQENPEIQEHPTIQLRQSSHLQTRLNDAIYHRYTRPGNLGPDLPNSDDYDNGSDTSSEGDYEAEDISIEEYVESDSESEADFPGEVPSFWNFEEEEFLKAAADLDGNFLDEHVLDLLRAYKFRVESNLTDRDFGRLRCVIPKAEMPSLKSIGTRVRQLSGIQSVHYDCCPHSCVCYTGPYKDDDKCPKCKTPRYRENGSPAAYFEYYPLIPRLRAMVASPQFATKMQYRSKHKHDPTKITDVFDGSHYQRLRKTHVSVDNTTLPTYFFSDPRDIALGLSTDGFGPFKRRNKTAWPIILFNYNLPPSERFRKKNIIPVGVIPGPKKPSDMDSFLWPLVQELVQLEIGIKAFDALSRTVFLLHVFLILVFGDIPAIAMIMRMKGQNGISPCRMCEIQAIRANNSNTHYVPLSRKNFPHAEPLEYDASSLPLRSHEKFMRQATEVQNALTTADHERLATQYGIKGIPLLSALGSLSFPTSFPYDFMHLIYANLIVNLILLWTGNFKDLDHSNEGYLLDKTVWDAIATAGAEAGDYIPSAFGTRVPNLAIEKKHMTCETYANWALYLAPVLLRGRFKNEKYYKHFVLLIKLLNSCLELEITQAEINKLEQGFRDWVQDYEKLYYQFDPDRVSTCPVTVHALLHIAPSIRAAGPVWAYWAFPMERFCGSILPHIRSRRHPYISINNYVGSINHLLQIELVYGIHDQLNLDPPPSTVRHLIHASYPRWSLSTQKKPQPLPLSLWKVVISTLATRYNKSTEVMRSIFPQTLCVVTYGRAKELDSGETIQGRDIVPLTADHRDMSFVRYQLEVDKYTHVRRRQPDLELRDFYGRVLRFFTLDLPAAPQHGVGAALIAFAVIRQLKVSRQIKDPFRICYFQDDNGAMEVVDLDQVQCLIGRIRDRNEWAVVDRSRSTVPVHI